MAKVHEQEPEEVDDDPEHPETDLENQFHKIPILSRILKLKNI